MISDVESGKVHFIVAEFARFFSNSMLDCGRISVPALQFDLLIEPILT